MSCMGAAALTVPMLKKQYRFARNSVFSFIGCRSFRQRERERKRMEKMYWINPEWKKNDCRTQFEYGFGRSKPLQLFIESRASNKEKQATNRLSTASVETMTKIVSYNIFLRIVSLYIVLISQPIGPDIFRIFARLSRLIDITAHSTEYVIINNDKK